MGIDVAAERKEKARQEKYAADKAEYFAEKKKLAEKKKKAPVGMPSPSAIPSKFICTQCGQPGKPRTITKGSILVELALWVIGVLFCWFFFISLIIPIAYSAWRLFSRTKGCKHCSGQMIKTDSPMGKQLLKNLEDNI